VADIVQPLLRGAGYTVALENLTQAERDTLYALRDFTRFRQDFSARIASEFYGVLQNRDAVRNNWRGLQNYKQTVARERAFFEEGLRSQASLDQLKQAELQTQTDWISAIRAYRQALDRFKVHIGLNTDSRFILDDRELEQLKIVHPELKIEDAVNVAMVSRLDLDTERDLLADAARHVKVAANGLLPQLDFRAYVDVNRTDSAFPVPDWQRQSWGTSLGLDLPIDRLRERNIYRASLIALDRSKRNFNTAVDTIKVQIADDWRNLDQAKRTYEIRELGVQIAARRVEEQQLRQELGRGTSRDLVDAQSDLISSKNQRTAALISHTIARLSLFRDMGMLWIKENGQWDEKLPATPEK
jgi:outer membrane protein TolC